MRQTVEYLLTWQKGQVCELPLHEAEALRDTGVVRFIDRPADPAPPVKAEAADAPAPAATAPVVHVGGGYYDVPLTRKRYQGKSKAMAAYRRAAKKAGAT